MWISTSTNPWGMYLHAKKIGLKIVYVHMFKLKMFQQPLSITS